MDVLQIIKSDHASLRMRLDEVETLLTDKPLMPSQLQSLFHELQLHLKLEGEYLYPELSSLLEEASINFIQKSIKNQDNIREIIDKLISDFTNHDFTSMRIQLPQLSQLVRDHLELEEMVLMPQLREAMPTSDREELGAVFIDIKESEGILAH